ncbi:MAG: hypothetical protein LBU04_04810 [Christensenellaceae bacterium]|jgi:hypothetical protein|nr:hypothetical protein [Christensenellaceae bacterium]
MEVWFKRLIADIALIALRVLDAFAKIFDVFTGVSPVSINETGGENINLITHIIQNEKISRAASLLILISIVSLTIFTIVALIKTMSSHQKTQGKILAAFGSAILAFVVVHGAMFGAMLVSNQFLLMINEATTTSQDDEAPLDLAQQIFKLSVGEDGWAVDTKTGEKSSIKDFRVGMNAREVFGSYDKLFGVEMSPDKAATYEDGTPYVDGDTFDHRNSTRIADLFKTNLFLLVLPPIILLVLFGASMLFLARRIFDIVILYLLMPFTVSAIPLDDGSRFKAWCSQMISRLVSVYGTAVAFNLFLMFTTFITNLNITSGEEGGFDNGFRNTVFKLFLILGLAFAISGGRALFTQLVMSGAQSSSGGGGGGLSKILSYSKAGVGALAHAIGAGGAKFSNMLKNTSKSEKSGASSGMDLGSQSFLGSGFESQAFLGGGGGAISGNSFNSAPNMSGGSYGSSTIAGSYIGNVTMANGQTQRMQVVFSQSMAYRTLPEPSRPIESENYMSNPAGNDNGKYPELSGCSYEIK